MGDIPAYGSITRSKQNATAGAQTPTASIITGLTIIVTSYFLMDYLRLLVFFWNLGCWTEQALMTINGPIEI
ncbi:hypothetical protein PGT21_029821 [Puccinia graminis f. sp. tritici]|uniref:SLC26A/SulP transporter domain-containing protein n=1 Tax=Puccinia graminis f. sp. tritici TaxID=56615 RepID=A0A5B0NTY2_PUCGR|nr:hypothetical protein PGT21_029821 [Puccinia graminis f. sp. tritici]